MNAQSQWRRQARAAAVIAVALLLAACGNPSATGSGSPSSANSPSAVGYSRCMRSHGVPNFPDPDSSGQLSKITGGQQVGVSDSVLQAARNACQALWPYQNQESQVPSAELLADYRQFARCMRANGVPKFPDPTADSGGPRFAISISRDGIDPQSPQIRATAQGCMHVMPAGSRLPSVSVSP